MSEPAKKATPLQVAKAVFWSFFGIRKSADYGRSLSRSTMA
jgi:hypothetical protein